jgi:hypothetical protein
MLKGLGLNAIYQDINDLFSGKVTGANESSPSTE